jgi:hypothetical protein
VTVRARPRRRDVLADIPKNCGETVENREVHRRKTETDREQRKTKTRLPWRAPSLRRAQGSLLAATRLISPVAIRGGARRSAMVGRRRMAVRTDRAGGGQAHARRRSRHHTCDVVESCRSMVARRDEMSECRAPAAKHGSACRARLAVRTGAARVSRSSPDRATAPGRRSTAMARPRDDAGRTRAIPRRHTIATRRPDPCQRQLFARCADHPA